MFLLTVGVIPTPAAQAGKVLCILCKLAQPTQKVQCFDCPAQQREAFVPALVIRYLIHSNNSVSQIILFCCCCQDLY